MKWFRIILLWVAVLLFNSSFSQPLDLVLTEDSIKDHSVEILRWNYVLTDGPVYPTKEIWSNAHIVHKDSIWNLAQANQGKYLWIGSRVSLGGHLKSLQLGISLQVVGKTHFFINGIMSDSINPSTISINNTEMPTFSEVSKEKPLDLVFRIHSPDGIPKKYNSDHVGRYPFDVQVGEAAYAIKSFSGMLVMLMSLLGICAGVFLGLGLLHLILFLFNKNELSNLYYFGVTICVGIILLFPSVLYTELITNKDWIINMSLILGHIYVTCFPLLLYAIFYDKLPRIKWLWLIMSFLGILTIPVSIGLSALILFIGLLATMLEGLRVLIVAFIKRKDGALIVGIGFLSYVLIFPLMIVVQSVIEDTTLETQIGDYIMVGVLWYCVLSVPISMSIYLARNYLRKNRKLEEQVDEIRKLSEETVRKEQEKQSILADQKEKLEVEVKARTIEVVRQKEMIETRNKEILDSIVYAKRIQKAILPPDRMVGKYLENSFVFFKPKDIVAGDFYWMEKVGNSVLFAAADCTGHGVPGAMVSVVCHNALNRAVREFSLTRPEQILNKVRELVEETFSKSDEDVKDGMDIALCALSKKDMKLEYAGANNSVYIVSDKELSEIKADKQPVGRYSYSKPFTGHDIKLKEGDIIYVFSDGYADQFGGPRGKKFKYKAFKTLLADIADLPMEDQKDKLAAAYEDWRGDIEQVDDVCIIGVRV